MGTTLQSRGGAAGSPGAEVLLELRPGDGGPLRTRVEEGLRDAVRHGRLPAGARLPSSRALAGDLGVSRRLVVDAYAQLLAEGWLVTRAGSGTFVAAAAAVAEEPPAPAPAPPAPLAFDFFPGAPDLTGFPRAAWLRAMRDALRHAPAAALGYPDPRGAHALRAALAGHLRRVRGVVAEPGSIVICSGTAQALVLLARALASGGEGPRLGVEDPGLPHLREILRGHAAKLTAMPVDCAGATVPAQADDLRAVLVTPAHQSPLGVAMTPARRAELLDWAAAGGRLVLEDDYDAEYRFDRAPVGALQGRAPDRVVYLGSASKTLAPALRLGWIVAPGELLDALVAQKALADNGCPTLEQLALASLIDSGAYDRHLRAARRRCRSRREALSGAVARHLPGSRVSGIAAGLHAVLRLPDAVDGLELMRAARRRSVGVYPLGYAYMQPRPIDDGLILGYANLSEAGIAEGVRRLAEAYAEVCGGGATPPARPPRRASHRA